MYGTIAVILFILLMIGSLLTIPSLLAANWALKEKNKKLKQDVNSLNDAVIEKLFANELVIDMDEFFNELECELSHQLFMCNTLEEQIKYKRLGNMLMKVKVELTAVTNEPEIIPEFEPTTTVKSECNWHDYD